MLIAGPSSIMMSLRRALALADKKGGGKQDVDFGKPVSIDTRQQAIAAHHARRTKPTGWAGKEDGRPAEHPMTPFDLTNLPASLHDLLDDRAETIGCETFAIMAEGPVTYAELAELSKRIAVGLSDRIEQGTRVVIMMPVSRLSLGIWFAMSRLGAVDTTINPAYKGPMLLQLVQTANPTLCIIDERMRDQFDEACHNHIDPASVINPATFARLDGTDPTSWTPRAVAPRDTAAILFTSGTTGNSKGVMVSQHQELAFGAAYAEITQLTADDITYNFLPFFHIAGRFTALGTMIAGGSMVLRPSFSVSVFWDDIRTHGATVVSAVGGLCHMLYSLPVSKSDADNTLRLIYAVPVPWEFKAEFEERFGLELIEGYGGTETNLVAYSRVDEPCPRGAIGKPSPHFDIQIQDMTGRAVKAGNVGEICIRPRYPSTILNGYFGLPEKTLEVFQDLWFHTGDAGRFDAEGYLYFTDRIKDTIRRRGENISSYEVERMMNQHRAVGESAVIAVPSELDEDEVKAVIVLKDGQSATEESLFLYATEVLPYFMVPRFIELREELPRTPTMKVTKHTLSADGNGARTWDCESHGYRISSRGFRK